MAISIKSLPIDILVFTRWISKFDAIVELAMEMLKFNLIVAICEKFGIGVKGELPWRLRYYYFILFILRLTIIFS